MHWLGRDTPCPKEVISRPIVSRSPKVIMLRQETWILLARFFLLKNLIAIHSVGFAHPGQAKAHRGRIEWRERGGDDMWRGQ